VKSFSRRRHGPSRCAFCDVSRVAPPVHFGPLFHLSCHSVELMQNARKAQTRAAELLAQTTERREKTRHRTG
jgi:hypothetical protein